MSKQKTDIAIQPPGLTLLWISAGLVTIGLIALSAGTILVGLLGLGLLFVCRFLARRHLNGLEISRPLPGRAFVGRSFPLEATLTNNQIRFAAVDFSFGDPAASSRMYATQFVPPGDQTRISYAGKCVRRGVIRPGGWTIAATWPLGLYRGERRGKFMETSTILAIPRPYLHERLQRHLDSVLAENALQSEWHSDSTADFRLLREFRSGDPVRAIHWPGSLRSGRMQVRQTEPPSPRPRRTCLVLHSFNPGGKLATPETFESILRIAAGLLIHFRDSNAEVDFHILPEERHRLRSHSDFNAALELLALLERRPIKKLKTRLARIEPLTDTYIISDSPCDQWEKVALSFFPNAVCIDTEGLSSRPLVSPLLRRVS